MTVIADFFDALADRWDELCIHAPEKINDILEHTTLHKGLRILDVGCGTGVLEQYLLTYAPIHITGIDLSPRMIEEARRMQRSKKLKLHIRKRIMERQSNYMKGY